MFGEHPNGSMMERDSHNVEFLEDEFPSVGEIKKDLKLFELQQDDILSLDEGKNLYIHRVTEESTLPTSERDDEILVAYEKQPENEVYP